MISTNTQMNSEIIEIIHRESIMMAMEKVIYI